MDQNYFNKIVAFFFTLQLNVKMYHWNTTSYARHKASDEFGGKLLSLIDKFVEVIIGRYKIKPNISEVKINPNFTDEGSERLLKESIEVLQTLPLKDTELLNIRDEMLAEINQTLYLYQLK